MYEFQSSVSTMFWLRVFVAIVSVFWPRPGESVLLHAYSPGDIIIGGLFPLHLKTNRSEMPGPVTCKSYSLRSFLQTQVMIYAIREINQRKPQVLPNITLGYDIYDTCGDVTLALGATLQLLGDQNCSQPMPSALDTLSSVLPEPRIKVVVGAKFSEVSTVVARLVALSSVTQISYASTSEVLSKKLKFPTFLRTISSDEHQTKAITELVKQFKWKTVAIVGSDDKYGKYGSDQLEYNFKKIKDICTDFVEILPDDFTEAHSEEKWDKVLDKIKNSSAEAVILFTKGDNVDVIMKQAIKQGLSRTWIGGDSWSTSSRVSEIPGIQTVGQVFGFTSKRNEVPGFMAYLLSMFNGTTNEFIKHHQSLYPFCVNQSEENRENSCNFTNSQQKCWNVTCLAKDVDQDESFNIYLAVHVIAEGLRQLLKCDNQQCQRSAEFTALELFKEIRKVNFTVNTTHVFFDENGDPSLGYDILYWNMTQPTQKIHIQTIGEYWPNGKMVIPDDLVEEFSKVTVSGHNCSNNCTPGHEKKQKKSCCHVCVPCPNGEFSPGNGTECKNCNMKQYSSPQRDKCLDKPLIYLKRSDPFSIILSVLGALGITVTIGFTVLFTINRHTPIVKAVGGYLCFLELLSLLSCFVLTFIIDGKPTKYSCMLARPFFGIAFSVCISCILANLLQIFVGFNFDLKIGSWLKKLNQPVAVVAVLSGIQLALCVPWMYLYPPFPGQHISSMHILLYCKKTSPHFYISMLSYNALLALICSLFAFKGKQLPDLYKNANLIVVSMLLFLTVWVIFIPIYLSLVGRYMNAIESSAIQISSYSILSCHLAPKCYIMVFRKELNNESALTEYIRKHYEQKGITVVKS